ncbi:hypothetical protein [Qipengyuania sphaerica]|uniref:hypothetical protein n=1 Tax=Qipengyuania sphaerica TaxID=2867243 RepID=UPI001C8824EB|nr:hypothetical protein [Qipengyuania sphaerica]MBX7539581.1 hypothetical protein [Qipengyuania sphaerica]
MNLNAKTAILAPLAVAMGACNPAAAVKAQLPEGETNLSCAAVIYAATSIYDDESAEFSDSLALITKYGDAYAREEGIKDGTEAFQRIKLEAMRMAGELPNSDQTIDDISAARRAKACAGK